MRVMHQEYPQSSRTVKQIKREQKIERLPEYGLRKKAVAFLKREAYYG
jgi:hypothetical protein